MPVQRGQVTRCSPAPSRICPMWSVDKAYAVNVFMFWPDPGAALRDIARLLRPGGVVALTQQPRARRRPRT